MGGSPQPTIHSIPSPPTTQPPLLRCARCARCAQDILFYQLPEHAHFYSELLNLLEESASGEQATTTALFSRFDALQLERVVGSARSVKMLKSSTGTFLFC